MNNKELAIKEFDTVIELYSKGEIREALNKINKLSLIYKDNAFLFNIRGACYAALGKPEKAIENYEKSISINPGNIDSLFNIGNIFREKNQLQDAVKSFKKIIALDPDQPISHFNLGVTLQELGKIHDAIDHYEYAKKHKEDYELMEGMTIILSNNLEENIATHYQGLDDEKKKEIQKINSKPKIKPWKFLFYNNHPKLNRVYYVGQIIRRNLHDQGLMSLRLDEGQFDSIITYHANPASPGYTTINEEYFPESGKWIFQALLDNRPIVENLKPLGFKNHSDVDVDHKHGNEGNEKLHFASSMQHHVQQCYFAIITETKYFHDRSVIRDGRKIVTTLDTNFLDSITFTEKTFKFLIAKIPFILCGMPNSLKVLRDMGYKTFSPYINEAYDLLEDDESRAIAIADEIERLCNMSDEWWVETQKALIPRMEHNFKMVSSITHRNYRFYL